MLRFFSKKKGNKDGEEASTSASSSPPPPSPSSSSSSTSSSSSSSSSAVALPKHGLTPTSVSAAGRPDEAAPVGLHLASRLFAHVSEEQAHQENLLLSPFSVGVALSLVTLGARGETAKQLRALLSSSSSAQASSSEADAVAEVAQEWGRVSKIDEGEGVQWTSTNAVWLSADCPVSPDLAALAGHLHGATIVGDLPIPTDPEQARQIINDAIAKQTRGHIKDLMPPRSINSDTRLVITNAVYFKGAWAMPFNPRLTVKADFNLLTKNKKVQVDMMHNPQLRAPYGSFEKHSMISLPYKSFELRMLILLPHKNSPEALQEVCGEETIAGLSNACLSLTAGKVDMWLPRFRSASSLELSKPVKDLGAELAFSGGADFSALTKTGEDLCIAAIFHQTFIDVNEEGTVAAAATAVAMSRGGAPPAPPVPFVVDRPFVCVLYHERLKCALFVGRVCDPSN